MSDNNTKCQDILTLIHDELGELFETLNEAPENSPKLNLNLEQLSILLSTWPNNLDKPFVILDENVILTRSLLSSLQNWPRVSDANQTWHLLSGDLSEAELSGQIVSGLSQTIHVFLQQKKYHFFLILNADLDKNLPDPKKYLKNKLEIHTGSSLDLETLIKHLVKNGYQRFDTALEPGGFRVRGENIDILQPTENNAITITFYRKTVETIFFQTESRKKPVPSIIIWPAKFPLGQTTIDEYLVNKFVLRPGDYKSLNPAQEFPFKPIADAGALRNKTVAAFYSNYDRTKNAVEAREINQALYCQTDASEFPLALETNSLALISENWLLPENKAANPISYDDGLMLLGSLTEGKPVVHSDHGIGIFDGLQSRTISDSTRDYLAVKYAGNDALFVPVEYAYKVTAYVGEDTPIIQKLGGATWKKTTAKAKRDAEAYAAELLAIAGKRANSTGFGYELNESLEDNLNKTFPFELTVDQAKAWQDVRQDMSQVQAMDRLIVGDVGFGKTEIAIRAASHAANNDQQVAILAPTTLLVQQHTDTFQKRLPEMADQIITLSRFLTSKEISEARNKLSSGEAKIAIGTHALLSRSTTWKNLGLVVIDEEQRFGVPQKEHFKKLRASVDLLSLSATPIPRTLSMALTGIKDLSIISSAPINRQEVTSEVSKQDVAKMKQAIDRELARDGQVYVVAPKIRSLHALAHEVQEIAPKASVAVAHGQLPPRQLAQIMKRFDSGELDILVSSSIIENGIDLPNANTIIVTSASHFGLSDLYQLRGRVGRRQTRGYAYFFYGQGKLNSVQRQRLTALTEASRLGSGWSLAQRDLEIRGAGNVLGAEQSGTVNAVGVQLYLDMVQEAVHQEEATEVRRQEVEIELPIIGLVPSHYIADARARTTAYQGLARARTPKHLQETYKKLTSQYGEPPLVTQALYEILLLQHAAAANGIYKISSKIISPNDENAYYKIVIQAKNLPKLLQRLQDIGSIAIQGASLVWHVDDIDLATIKKLISRL